MFILASQLFIFLDNFLALCILLSKVASCLLHSSISQSILLLFWVSLPFEVGRIYHNRSASNTRGTYSIIRNVLSGEKCLLYTTC